MVHDAAVEVPGAVTRGWAYSVFEGAGRRLLIDLKFDGLLRAGWMMGRRMAEAPGAEGFLAEADAVVPVPLHWWRRWRRGHNQALVLARALGRRSGLGVVSALRRCRYTRPQVGLERHVRGGNVRGAFVVRDRYRQRLAGKRVVLVDDVITTGSTVAAAADALTEAGAVAVVAYAAAWARD